MCLWCVSRPNGDYKYFDEDAKVRNKEREREKTEDKRQKKEERQHFNPESCV